MYGSTAAPPPAPPGSPPQLRPAHRGHCRPRPAPCTRRALMTPTAQHTSPAVQELAKRLRRLSHTHRGVGGPGTGGRGGTQRCMSIAAPACRLYQQLWGRPGSNAVAAARHMALCSGRGWGGSGGGGGSAGGGGGGGTVVCAALETGGAGARCGEAGRKEHQHLHPAARAATWLQRPPAPEPGPQHPRQPQAATIPQPPHACGWQQDRALRRRRSRLRAPRLNEVDPAGRHPGACAAPGARLLPGPASCSPPAPCPGRGGPHCSRPGWPTL